MNSIDAQKSTPLHVAATYNNSGVVRLLLNAPDIRVTVEDYQNQNVLHRAAKEGHYKVVMVVLDHLEACEDGEVTLKTMMSTKDTRGATPFMLAVQSGHPVTLKTFLDRANSSPFVDKPNNINEYPLHMACRSGDTETAELLVQHGASINKCNDFNESPLFLAADYCENKDLVEFLVKQ